MGIALAVLVLTALSVGFISLMFLPLIFIWLAASVYLEPWKEPAPEIVEAPKAAEPTQPTEPTLTEPAIEKPRVMVAGRRRPL
jgi:hypothetical protein